MSCCPPDSLGYLAPDPSASGKVTTAGGAEFYETGPGESTSAIILFPDVWGWNSGRTRALADEFGRQGYRVYVPKSFVEPLEGGTDGDGLPPDFDIGARGSEFGPWVTKSPWSALQPRFEALITYAKQQGAVSLGAVGCCWGGWAAFHSSAICADIKAAVIFHPSCQLEGMFGGDVEKLCQQVQCPVYFMPAQGDSPDLYGPTGALTVILHEKFGSATKTKLFSDMSHGWVPRGDVADAKVKRDVQLAMEEAAAYLAEYLPCLPKESL